MNQIARCDWLPERDYPLYPASKISLKSHIINPSLTKFVRSRWLDIGLVLFFFESLWTSTSSRSINRQKKNLANIQLSWPLAWTITIRHFFFLAYTLAWGLVFIPKRIEWLVGYNNSVRGHCSSVLLLSSSKKFVHYPCHLDSTLESGRSTALSPPPWSLIAFVVLCTSFSSLKRLSSPTLSLVP